MIEKPKAPELIWHSTEARMKFKDPMMKMAEMQRLVNSVWDRIPTAAAVAIIDFLKIPQVRLTFDDTEAYVGDLDWYKRQIKFNLNEAQLRSEECIARLYYACAHEFAHAYWLMMCSYIFDNLKLKKEKGEEYLSLIAFPPRGHLYGKKMEVHEKMANAIAISWGFLPELAEGEINDGHFQHVEKKIEKGTDSESLNLVVDIIKTARILKKRFPKRI
jgi:hypothetical protein